jgi:hypothetical protein
MTRSNVIRLSLIALFCMATVLVSAPNASAVDFQFTSDHCTGGCGTPPFGTVSVTQAGANVNFVVTLNAGYSFVKTGSADFMAFKFNGVGVAVGDIVVAAHVPVLAAATGALNGNGTGTFVFGIECPSCGNGASGAFSAPISFTVNNATIADVTQPNADGNIFVADVLAPNGNTGPIDVSTPPTNVPEPTSLTLLGFGILSAGLAWRKRSK